ncbi:hypothetical protein B0H21DRAFT_781920 [Amylocystis lapponica]|nr:hypothetical protein B0H21DRAFT_782067 [Amylocystis lapponica]KAH9917088.1 hypothetical protein B0H21DRAFT_781920 [Amylocystis lapponica]
MAPNTPRKPPSRAAAKPRIPLAQKKPPPTPVDRLKRLFTSLCAQIDGGHFANALKTCDKVLRIAPDDADALQTKRFLLLQTEQYTPALVLIGDAGDGRFERAYALYRLHHEDDAEATLRALKEHSADERGVLHLEAQLAYRQGAYHAAFDLYNQLLDTAAPHSEEQSDILTNLDAAQAHLDFLAAGFQRALAQLPAALTGSLETAPPPAAPSSAVVALAQEQASAPPEKPVRKVRAKRVPAGVVPGVTPPPDPERWLKKSERTVATSGRRRKGGGGGATQGAMESAGTGHGAKSAGGGGKGKKKK